MKFNNIISFSFLAVLISMFIFSACTKNTIPDRSWNLVWEDNFDGEAGQLPSAELWKYDIGRGPNNDGWGNQELQYYTDRAENVSLDGNGNLAIVARAETFGGAGFTSARILTQGIFDQKYGRFEARIKMPYGPGLWPAFWMLGSSIDEEGWPQCGEIDIMEYRGQEPSIIHGSIHGPGYSGGAAVTKSYTLLNDRYDKDFHLFAIEWGENYIDYFVDEVLYFRATPEDVSGEWVYDQPFFILLNVAVGGNYVGFPTSQTIFPQTMLVDYVKVYTEVN